MKFVTAAALCAVLFASPAFAREVSDFLRPGDTEFASGHYSYALQFYRSALKLAPTDPRVLYRMEKVYEKLGDVSIATEYHNKTVAALKAAGLAAEQARPPATQERPVTIAQQAVPKTAGDIARPAPPHVDTAGSYGGYHVGQKVEFIMNGGGNVWTKGVVVAVGNSATAPHDLSIDHAPLRLHPLGYISTIDQWTQLKYVRPYGSGQTAPVPGGAQGEANDEALRKLGLSAGSAQSRQLAAQANSGSVQAKRYSCVAFIGGTLVHQFDFTIRPGNAYTDGNGAPGTYTMNGNVITFHRGANDGTKARYDASSGHSVIHILSERGNSVMDCA